MKVKNNYFRVLDDYVVKSSSREVKFSSLKIDFTNKTIADLPLKYQQLLEKHKKNKQWIINQETIINKREDVKGKKLLSKNEEDMMIAYKQFYDKETEIYNEFLGENGVQKLLNGRAMGWTRLQEIDNIINTQIVPKLDISKEKIIDKIKSTYGSNDSEELK